MTGRGLPARLRGVAVGLLTAALAFAAHGLSSGAIPSGAGVALLAVLAATVGAVASTSERACGARMLMMLLGAGQLVGHLILALAGHDQHGCLVPPVAMLAAHALAVVVGAALLAACERLCHAVCRVLRTVELPRDLASSAATPAVSGDQPMRAALLLAASVSHRGPPVGLALPT